jgi:hypothetical protein
MVTAKVLQANPDDQEQPTTAERFWNWFFFGVAITLAPFVAVLFGDMDRHINLSLAALFGQGQLLIIAVVISAAGIGDLIASDAKGNRKASKKAILGFSVISLVATCIWFGDISSLLFTKNPADPKTVAIGSLIAFGAACLEGLSVLLISEG